MNTTELSVEVKKLIEVVKVQQENIERQHNRIAILELDCAWLRKELSSMKGKVNYLDSSRE